MGLSMVECFHFYSSTMITHYWTIISDISNAELNIRSIQLYTFWVLIKWFCHWLFGCQPNLFGIRLYEYLCMWIERFADQGIFFHLQSQSTPRRRIQLCSRQESSSSKYSNWFRSKSRENYAKLPVILYANYHSLFKFKPVITPFLLKKSYQTKPILEFFSQNYRKPRWT